MRVTTACVPHRQRAGYYGNSYTASYVEDSPAGSDYLAEICKEWESAAQVRGWGGEGRGAGGTQPALGHRPAVLSTEGEGRAR